MQARFAGDLAEDENLRNSNVVDKRVFNKWAEEYIDEMREPGRNVAPLIRELT